IIPTTSGLLLQYSHLLFSESQSTETKPQRLPRALQTFSCHSVPIFLHSPQKRSSISSKRTLQSQRSPRPLRFYWPQSFTPPCAASLHSGANSDSAQSLTSSAHSSPQSITPPLEPSASNPESLA